MREIAISMYVAEFRFWKCSVQIVVREMFGKVSLWFSRRDISRQGKHMRSLQSARTLCLHAIRKVQGIGI